MIWNILAMIAIGVGLLISLLMAGFTVAGMPNSSPEQLRFLTILAWSFAIGGVLVAGVSGGLVYFGQPRIAMGIGLIPVVVMIICVIIAFRGS